MSLTSELLMTGGSSLHSLGGYLGRRGRWGGPCSWSWLSPYTLMVMPSDPPGPLTCTTMRVLLSPLSESCSR